jgi:hypothetical protein
MTSAVNPSHLRITAIASPWPGESGGELLRLSWWIWATRLIRCTIVPLIHRQARIHHGNPQPQANFRHMRTTSQP